jgi:hypothetical protein
VQNALNDLEGNMQRTWMLFAPAIFALTVSTSVHANEPPVKVNVSHLQPAVAAEVQKHAAKGMTALTRYLESTRKQHGLWIDDVTRAPDTRDPNEVKAPPRDYKQHAQEWKK